MLYLAKIRIMPKQGVLDPQGNAVLHALESLGFNDVGDVRLGKYLEIKLQRGSPTQAREDVEVMCRKLLANLVIESYEFDISSLN